MHNDHEDGDAANRIQLGNSSLHFGLMGLLGQAQHHYSATKPLMRDRLVTPGAREY
jgi:hypothetical protein